jgi:hypothetical protein
MVAMLMEKQMGKTFPGVNVVFSIIKIYKELGSQKTFDNKGSLICANIIKIDSNCRALKF